MILVTGAGGMVGSHMIERLHNCGEQVIGTYYKPTTDINELSSDIKMIECEMCIRDRNIPGQRIHCRI